MHRRKTLWHVKCQFGEHGRSRVSKGGKGGNNTRPDYVGHCNLSLSLWFLLYGKCGATGQRGNQVHCNTES